MKRFWRWLLVAVWWWAAAAAHGADGPVIAAASDLKFALDEIVVEFQKSTGQSVRVSYGSSGNFVRQIAQDAPFELFLSADEAFVCSSVAGVLPVTRFNGSPIGDGRPGAWTRRAREDRERYIVEG